jgi:Tol biopolymer transport system component
MPENHAANGRLDSWKEIADYLKRDVRTAIRWEKEKGLPVHRVPGGRRQTVFAHQHEIDAWMRSENNSGRQTTAASEALISRADEPSKEPEGTSNPEIRLAEIYQGPVGSTDRNIFRLLSRRRPFVVGAVCLLIMSVGGWLMRPHKVTGLRVVSIRQLTDDAHEKGNLQSDGNTLYFNLMEGAHLVLKSAPASGSPIRSIETPFSNVSLLDLSKDGKTLLVLSYSGIVVEGPLWTIPTQGGKPRHVGEAVCNYARWSPENTKIACARSTTIVVMDADGGNSRIVGAFAAPVRLVGWTPDGQRIRFVLEHAAAHAASQWEININGKDSQAQARPLNLGENCCSDWRWTGDGKKFIYTEIDGAGKSHLRIQTHDSSRGDELPINIGTLGMAIPGRSADSLFLLISNTYRGELLKFNGKREGGLQTYLPGVSAAFVAFSPDGKWITYVNTQDNTLWRSRVDGSEALQLIKPPMEVEVSSWSPDGQNIAFMACMPGKPWRIYLVGRDGGGMREVSEGTDSQGGPSWSPDGKFIAYGNVDCERTQSCWIRKLEVANGKTEIIPGSSGFRTARWSPNGKYIAALRFQTRELMLLDLSNQRWKVVADSVSGDNVNWSSDSRYVYVDDFGTIKPAIERVRIGDLRRETVISLESLQRAPGTISNWFGLTPENAPVVLHVLASSEIYELKWAEQ